LDSDTEHRKPDGSASNAEKLLPLHVAEYQALTNRNTYLIAIQYSFWPVIFLLTTLVAQLWTSGSDKIAQSALSVWFGDLVMLPIFNWLVVRFVARYKRDHTETATTAALSAAFLPAAVVAVVVNSYTHFIWTQDQYFGFIDPTPGKLSFAGWWHYGFSIVETVIVLMFIQIWLRADSSHKASGRRGYQAWYVFLAYCLLSVADFTVLHWIILPRRTEHDYSGWTGWPGLLVIVFWAAVSVRKKASAHRSVRADA